MSPRNTRARQAKGASHVGERHEVTVGPIAHGGHCVARIPVAGSTEGETRVVFVRHALPDEVVTVEITEGTEGDRFWRGDAVSVATPSPKRVTPPCPVAGPGLCGGCDFQHVTPGEQRALKARVVQEQFRRLAHMEVDVVVEQVPGDKAGLEWRTRVEYAATPDGHRGMRKHRSHGVVPIETCLIAAPGAIDTSVSGSAPVIESVHGREFAVAADGFWQVHPGAPEKLVDTVLDYLDPQPGEKALDLYSGVGLFARFLAERVGEGGRVVAIEGNKQACGHARDNLAEHRKAVVGVGTVDRVLATTYDEPFDVVVLDPPREGARRKVVLQIVDRAPRAVAYVACDPASLARDAATFVEAGYRLEKLRAFDLFPMTHHVECVALFVR
ncbi:class I SAM-dependent RNA methyltransferase [Nocardioides sp. Root140]|uniref:class I SAM-dependent RNA methyltransferase n=1 Tax=Nocardioides sp. Root140 TaxID=1736460 RepID=UPI0006F64DD6|nr:TRAM domain-containing protein [Nocardioides sp. Root140]KQY64099.1 SAM-dependent methyltransferase [Nocardioides sp. Root140]